MSPLVPLVNRDAWLARETISIFEAVHLMLGYEPPMEHGTFQLAVMSGAEDWLSEQKLVHEPNNPPGSVLVFTLGIIFVSEFVNALRKQPKPPRWGRLFTEERAADRGPSEQEQRKKALAEHLTKLGIPRTHWRRLSAHGIRKKELFRELQKANPKLFRSLATFNHFFQDQQEVRIR